MVILVPMIMIGVFSYLIVAGAAALKSGDERRREDEAQAEYLRRKG